MGQVYIYSTLANNQIYNVWKQFGGLGKPNISDLDKRIVIRGGTGVMNKRGEVPVGQVTIITDDQYALLKENKSFQQHVQNGFVKVSDAKVDPEVAAADDMNTRDESAQAVEADLKEAAPTVNLESEKTSSLRKAAGK